MASFIGRARGRWPVRFAEQFVSRWQEHRVGGLAAEIAFWGLLSLLPLLLVVTAGLGWLADLGGAGTSADIEQWVVDQATNIFGDSSEVVELFSGLFDGTSGDALTVGALAALYTASRGFATTVRALDVAYDIEQRRGWVGARLVGLLLALSAVVVGVLIVSLIVVGPLFGGADEIAGDLGFGSKFRTFWQWIRWPLAVLVLVSWAASMYQIAPNHRTPWRWELPGAVVAMVAWAAASYGFQFFLAIMGETNAVFGVLGAAISLLVWIYFLALGLLIGAELNGILADWHGLGEQRYQPKPVRNAFWWWWHRRERDQRERDAELLAAADHHPPPPPPTQPTPIVALPEERPPPPVNPADGS